MAVNPGAANACLITQQALSNVSKNIVPTTKITAPGLIQAITSPTNTNGFEVIKSQDPTGLNADPRVSYWQNPRTEAGTDSGGPDICTDGTTVGKLYANVSTPNERNVELTLNEPEFREFCGDTNGSDIVVSPFAQQQIQGKMNQLIAGINSDLTDYAVAHAGNFYNAIAGPKTITLVDSNGAPAYHGENEIISDQEDVGAVQKPFAVGAGYLRTYTQLAKILCCNDDGLDASGVAASGFNYFFDRGIETATAGTTQDFLVLEPGALQLIGNNRWVGPFDDAVNGTAEKANIKTTVTVPIPNGGTITVDMTVYRSFCGSNNDGATSWKLTWNYRFGMFSLPADVEAVGSPYSGYNGITHYIGTCGDITCADVES